MVKLMGKEINVILGASTILMWTYDHFEYWSTDFKLRKVLKIVSLLVVQLQNHIFSYPIISNHFAFFSSF